ncbi:hypothetical protein LCGC14_1140950 [marine sediment metagenome]|uniref:Uncharacterized protein n=1 Tax=marine sediment metagenome TaxID=412755 RepID=A0A0F9PGH1_9ZZZZ
MRSEHVKSCGCWHKEKPLKHGHSRVGMTSPEYRCWCSLRGRCCSKTHEAYSRYGGRGIAICKRWLKSFMAFYRDMGPRPGPEYSLDRINNDGPYSKSNCRWALRVTQGRNRSNNRKLEFQGECLCISEWAERMGCQHQRITARLRRGWCLLVTSRRPHRPGSGFRRRGRGRNSAQPFSSDSPSSLLKAPSKRWRSRRAIPSLPLSSATSSTISQPIEQSQRSGESTTGLKLMHLRAPSQRWNKRHPIRSLPPSGNPNQIP